MRIPSLVFRIIALFVFVIVCDGEGKTNSKRLPINALFCDLVTYSGLLSETCNSGSRSYLACDGGAPQLNDVTSCSKAGAVTGLALSNLDLVVTDDLEAAFDELGLLSLKITSSTLSPENTIPSLIGKLNTLTSLDLSSNNLAGPLPTLDLVNLVSLKTLIMKNNKFTGTIPEMLAALKNLKTLDLSNNNLQGSIPDDLCSLNLLTLDLSRNPKVVCYAPCLASVPNHNYGVAVPCTPAPTLVPTARPSTYSPTGTGICLE